MSLTDVDRLAAALLTLLQTRDIKYIEENSNGLVTSRPSFTDERKARQHLPLSAAVSLPTPITRLSTSKHHWRRSTVDPMAAAPPPPSLGLRQDEDRGRATTTSARYKTELCRAYAEHGACRYGDKCQFAHGVDDLRAVARHPKYKTDLCRTYHTTGLCPYGPRCHFVHNEDEARPRPPPPPPSAKDRDVELARRELEYRLALLNLYQREKLPPQSATSSYFHLDQSTTSSVVPPAVPQWHVSLDRRQSVPVTVFQSSTQPSDLIDVSSPQVAGALGSVGNSPTSSAADDDSPPPLSPTLGAFDASRQLASNDRLAALLTLATKLRLLRGTSN